jgi:pantoate kinase
MSDTPTAQSGTATGQSGTATGQSETATAHAPGSVTVVFAPTADGDGSYGISFTTADGVTARVAPAAETEISLNGTETAFEPVAGVLSRLDTTARVELDAATPVGAGFGASGAATLATALAANEAFDLGRERAALVSAAHAAEVAAGTGLGDVFVQERGGLVFDVGDGRARRSRTDDLWYVSHGGIPTERVLGDDDAMDRVRTAASDAFDAFDPDAPLAELFAHSRQFAEATGLLTEQVRETLADVEAAGGSGAMAMVGETVLAAGAPDVLPNATRITSEGARVVSEE